MILEKDPTHGLDDTALIVEKEYLINSTDQRKKFCFSLLYNGVTANIIVNGVEIYKFKAKYSETNASALSLGNILKHYVHNIDVDNTSDIRIYLMKKNDIKCF